MNPGQPYVGPKPFELDDMEYFFGRDQEADELLSLVIANTVVLVYAASGVGKTSLVNARLVPLLEREGFEVLPCARVRGLDDKDSDHSDVGNIFAFNTIVSWSLGNIRKADIADKTLSAYLGGLDRAKDAYDTPISRAIIFDQFEELFLCYRERWTDRKAFFLQVAEALQADPQLSVIFVMREEHIAQLEPCVSILPGRLHVRFRLNPLRREAAVKAVKEPAEKMGVSYADGVAETLVDDLLTIRSIDYATEAKNVKGEFVEPVQLQIVCQALWKSLPPTVTEITQEHLTSAGDVDDALTHFYEDTVKSAVDKLGISEGKLRSWFDHDLITPESTRGIVYRGDTETSGIPNEVVDWLESLHIIRAEPRCGSIWYELTHDRLITPILNSNQSWKTIYAADEAVRARLETQAAEWQKAGHSKRELLDKADLVEAERWLSSPEAAQLTTSKTVSEWIDASRKRVQYLRRMVLASVITLFIVLFGVIGNEVITQRYRAEHYERQAKQASRQASTSKRQLVALRPFVDKSEMQKAINPIRKEAYRLWDDGLKQDAKNKIDKVIVLSAASGESLNYGNMALAASKKHGDANEELDIVLALAKENKGVQSAKYLERAAQIQAADHKSEYAMNLLHQAVKQRKYLDNFSPETLELYRKVIKQSNPDWTRMYDRYVVGTVACAYQQAAELAFNERDRNRYGKVAIEILEKQIRVLKSLIQKEPKRKERKRYQGTINRYQARIQKIDKLLRYTGNNPTSAVLR